MRWIMAVVPDARIKLPRRLAQYGRLQLLMLFAEEFPGNITPNVCKVAIEYHQLETFRWLLPLFKFDRAFTFVDDIVHARDIDFMQYFLTIFPNESYSVQYFAAAEKWKIGLDWLRTHKFPQYFHD